MIGHQSKILEKAASMLDQTQLAPTYCNLNNELLETIPNQSLKPRFCQGPPLCQTPWKPKYAGCKTTYIDGPQTQCTINYPGDRINVADLRPLMYERGRLFGSKPNFYNNFRTRRQKWIQMITQEWAPKNSGYIKKIENPNESFCLNQRLYGPPQYIDF